MPRVDLHQPLADPREALHGTAVERVRDVDPVAVERHADRETPPLEISWTRRNSVPRTANTVTVSLPAFTA